MELINHIFGIATGLINYVLQGYIIYGIFLLIERLRPVEAKQPFRHIFFNLQWYVIYIVIASLLSATGISGLGKLIQTGLGGPYFIFPKPDNLLATIIGIFIYFLIVDFFYYWLHRFQHQLGFLWEQHKFHHSEVSMNVTTTRRVHWLEEILIIAFILIPMAVLFDIQPIQAGILALIEVLWLQFIHLNLRLELGIFSPIIVGPQHHRIHHSFAAEHLDKNFALFFPIWDIIFRTYYHPHKGEFPPTGLTSDDTQDYNHLGLAMILPFKEWSGERYLGRLKKKFLKHE